MASAGAETGLLSNKVKRNKCYMKRKSVFISVCIAASVLLAACGKNNTQPEEGLPVTVTQSESVSESAAENISEDILEDDDSDLEEYFPDIAEDEEETAEPNPLMPIIDKALSESEWPALNEVSDEFILKEFFLLDPANENYSQMIVMQCPISAVMSEIIIINAVDVSQAEEDLNARRTKAVEQDAWYPNDKLLAEASIVGTNGSYAYFIIGENAEAAEKSINDYIDSI